ncbi:pilus assembly protein PilP [Thermithiobacillus plumbiphilus]|uniref:Pilus assembly protein PilP n=1 Tax=Thermithiobacillus plumbiphilus TaxID=1729899 RepID=A0ABU9D913_9PROT
MNHKAFWSVAFLLGGALSLGGCAQGDDMADLKQFVAAAPKSGKSIEKLPEAPLPSIILYTGENRRDPFTSFEESRRKERTLEIAKGPRPNSNRVRQVLEEFDLGSLNLVGIVRDVKGQPWGLIKTPDGKVYRVTLGNYLGRNDGRVVEIVQRPGESALRLIELVPATDGGFEKRQQRIEMSTNP